MCELRSSITITKSQKQLGHLRLRRYLIILCSYQSRRLYEQPACRKILARAPTVGKTKPWITGRLPIQSKTLLTPAQHVWDIGGQSLTILYDARCTKRVDAAASFEFSAVCDGRAAQILSAQRLSPLSLLRDRLEPAKRVESSVVCADVGSFYGLASIHALARLITNLSASSAVLN
jgi:hypothetical protein